MEPGRYYQWFNEEAPTTLISMEQRNIEISVQWEAKLASATSGEGSQYNFYWIGQIFMSRDKNCFTMPNYRVIKYFHRLRIRYFEGIFSRI